MASPREYEMLLKLGASLGSNFSSSFKSAQAAVLAMQSEVQAFNKIQADIGAYQKQQSAIGATKSKLSILQQQYDSIQREIDETGTHSSTLENKLLAKQLQIEETSGKVDAHTATLNQMGEALQRAGVNTDNLSGESQRLSKQIDELKAEQEEAARGADNFGTSGAEAFQAIQDALVAAGIAAALKEIYEYLSVCTDASMEFESGMAGVAKTTDMNDKELLAMAESLKTLSTEIPATTTELAGVAEAAGQLGVAKQDILDFTAVMTNLGVATNLTSDDAATQLAKFANITKMAAADYERLGSTIVALGNNSATTEADIVNMGMRLASAGKQAGMTEAEVMSIAAALSSLGLESQAGGSSFSKVISQMQIAVETGSESLKDYAEVAGMSAREFAVAFGTDAAGALAAFTTGLSDTERLGASATVLLEEMGISELRMSDALKRAAEAGDLFNDTLALGNQAWSENTALQKEAATRYATTESQLQMLQNSYNNLQIAIGDAFTPVLREAYGVGTELLDGVAKFIAQNPELVTGITVFVGVLGLAAAAILAYTAYTKIATAVTTAFGVASMSAMGPIMLVVGAVAAVAGGIAMLATAARNDGIPSVKELTEASREMHDVMREASEAYEDTVASTQAASNVAETYIRRLEAMEAAGVNTGKEARKTDEQAREYHNTLALLCEVVPELTELIDLENDVINGGTDALLANTEAWKQNALQQAHQEKLTALAKAHSDVLVEQELNSVRLTDAKEKQQAAEQAVQDEFERQQKLWEQANKAAEAYYKETGMWTEATGFLGESTQELENKLIALNDEVWASQEMVKAYEKAIDEGSEAAEAAAAELGVAEKAFNNLSDATSKETQAAQENIEAQLELKGVIGEITAEMAELAEAYEEAYDAALSSVEGQYDLWDKADKVSATKISKMNSAIESQTKYWQDYNANLESLGGRAGDIAGLQEMMASFADGSTDSVNAIAGMAKASDEDLKAMAASWTALKEAQGGTADNLAELETNFTTTMGNLQSELESTIAEMDLNAEAAEVGKNTIQGFINSAEEMLPQVIQAYKSVGDAAIKAMKDSVKTASPSREAAWIGEMTIAGFNLGAERENEKTRETFGGVADTAIEAMTPHDYSSGLGRGPRVFQEFGPEPVSYGASGSGTVINIELSPVYNIGSGSASGLTEQLKRHDQELIQLIREVMEEIEEDKQRTEL